MVVCPVSWVTCCMATDNVKQCPTFMESVAVPNVWHQLPSRASQNPRWTQTNREDFEEGGCGIIKILHKYLLKTLRKTTGDLRTVGVPARTRATQPVRSLPKCTASHPAIPDFHTHHCHNLRCHTNKSQLRVCLYKLAFLPNQLCLCLANTFPYEISRTLTSVQPTGNKDTDFFFTRVSVDCLHVYNFRL
jgi:hypothetical protein